MSRCDTPKPEKIRTVPNQPKTPVRTVRLADAVWDRVKALAAKRQVPVSDVHREAIERGLAAMEEESR